jgi:predicted transcriptional regulator
VAIMSTQMFSDAELWLMELLWLRGSATIDEVVRAIPRRAAFPSGAVSMGLSSLESKGLIRSERRGPMSVYRPA